MSTILHGINMNTALQGHAIMVRLPGMKRFKARVWLGVRIMKLAAFVIGTGFSFTFEETDKQG